MPATTSPPGVSTGSIAADSTRQTASPSCSGIAEDVGEHVPGVERVDARAIERAHTRAPGSIRAPAAITWRSPHLGVLSDHHVALELGMRPDLRTLGDDAVAKHATRADLGPGEHHRSLDRCVGADAHSLAQDDQRPDPRAGVDHAARADDGAAGAPRQRRRWRRRR